MALLIAFEINQQRIVERLTRAVNKTRFRQRCRDLTQVQNVAVECAYEETRVAGEAANFFAVDGTVAGQPVIVGYCFFQRKPQALPMLALAGGKDAGLRGQQRFHQALAATRKAENENGSGRAFCLVCRFGWLRRQIYGDNIFNLLLRRRSVIAEALLPLCIAFGFGFGHGEGQAVFILRALAFLADELAQLIEDGVVLFKAVHPGKVVMCLDVILIDGHSLGKFSQCLFRVAPAFEYRAEIVVRLGVAGVVQDSLLIGVDGSIHLASRFQGVAQIIVGLGIVGLQRDSAAEAFGGKF